VFSLALVILGLQTPPDTVTLSVAEAFEQALATSPEMITARSRAEAARNRAAQSLAHGNPRLTIAAENIGRTRELVGLDAPDGIEGQAVFTTALPFGPTRSGTVGMARAAGATGEAQGRLEEQTATLATLAALGSLLRAQAMVEHGQIEAETLDQLAEALALQAREGRAAASEAARAQLARGLAATALARREGALAVAMADVTRRLGLAPDAWVELDLPRCTPGSNSSTEPPLATSLPEAEIAAARVDAARWSVDVARGVAAPDLEPQIGLRRGGGYSALYLGFSTTLPLFDRGSRGVAAARDETRAAEAELALVESRLAADVVAARRSLEALEHAGGVFTTTWFDALEQAVTAADLRYELGEANLYELLDHRRARLQALDDYAVWQAEWWQARTHLSRLTGRSPDAALLCSDPFREND
jgi:outer membrane protein TolC